MEERAAFERAIDEAPHDSNNHLVYADWLDDHGEPEEAAFRRSMGRWMLEEGRYARPTPGTGATAWVSDRRFLPEGVSGEHIPGPREDAPWTTHQTYRDMEHVFRNSFMTNLGHKRLSRKAAVYSRLRRG